MLSVIIVGKVGTVSSVFSSHYRLRTPRCARARSHTYKQHVFLASNRLYKPRPFVQRPESARSVALHRF